LVVFLPILPYIYRIYMVLANSIFGMFGTEIAKCTSHGINIGFQPTLFMKCDCDCNCISTKRLIDQQRRGCTDWSQHVICLQRVSLFRCVQLHNTHAFEHTHTHKHIHKRTHTHTPNAPYTAPRNVHVQCSYDLHTHMYEHTKFYVSYTRT